MVHSRLLLVFNLIHLTTAQLPTSKATSALTQPFLHPIRGDVLLPGSIFTIQWDANPAFKNITLQLWDKTSWGFARDLLSPCHPWARNPFCGTIAASAPNTGSFAWLVPNPQNGTLGFGFPRGEHAYWVKMYVEDYLQPGIGNKDPVLSYSQNFAFAREGEAAILVTVQPTATSGEGDGGPPTVFVTVAGDGTASVTGEGDVVETGTGTGTGTVEATGSRGNKTAFVTHPEKVCMKSRRPNHYRDAENAHYADVLKQHTQRPVAAQPNKETLIPPLTLTSPHHSTSNKLAEPSACTIRTRQRPPVSTAPHQICAQRGQPYGALRDGPRRIVACVGRDFSAGRSRSETPRAAPELAKRGSGAAASTLTASLGLVRAAGRAKLAWMECGSGLVRDMHGRREREACSAVYTVDYTKLREQRHSFPMRRSGDV
ncbi:hypothetical protein PSPO01_05592 [Paraphaeosphaeria sporulosa]